MTKLKHIVLFVLLTISMASCFLFPKKNGDYVKQNKMPVQGIDISHHQGIIDWNELKTENLAFIFMKATEGTTFKDPAFDNYLKYSTEINLKVGAYHFFSFCKQAMTRPIISSQRYQKINIFYPCWIWNSIPKMNAGKQKKKL